MEKFTNVITRILMAFFWTVACLMVGICGATIIFVVGSQRQPSQSEYSAVVPEHFRVVVDRKTVDGFVGTNIDGTRFVTARFVVDPFTRRMISESDTLDSWFEERALRVRLKLKDWEFPIHYTERYVLAIDAQKN